MTQSAKSTPPIAIPLIFCIIFISFSAIFVKWSNAPATVLGMYRMFLAVLFLSPIIWIKRTEFRKITRKGWLFLFCSGTFLGLHFAFWFYSLELTTVASSTLILSLQPIVALIGAFLVYRERADFFMVALILFSMIGVGFVSWGDFQLDKQAIIGDFYSFLSVIAVVSYLLIGQNVVKGLSHWVYSFTVFLVAGLTLLLYNVISQAPLTGYDEREWGIFLLIAIFPTLSHIIYNWLLNYVNSTTISMTILGEPIGATILAFFLLGETINSWQIFGGSIVLIGVFLFLIRERNRVVSS